jgi:glycine oxidase
MTETSQTSSKSSATNAGAARPRVAIIGAGVCGLGIGWRLAQAGCEVAAYDKGEAGHGASWASAGMLAGGLETEPGEEALLPLAQLSQRMWPEFARELRAASGIDVEYRDEGILAVALTHDDLEQLRFTYEFQTGLGIELEWLSGAAARAREPHLKSGLAGAVYSAGDHQVENRQLSLALKEAFVRAGGRLSENTAVTGIDLDGARVRGLWLGERHVAADVVVLAAGAWSRDIEGLPEAARPPVRPLKGQALALRMDPAAPLIRHVVWVPKGYLVPRNDGRLLVGATVEERGFDEALTAGGVFALLESAWRALPAIEELAIDELWVGFRPGSRDDAPILGATPVDGLMLATGHHRNGILLAPVTAEAVARLVLTGTPLEGTEPFGIERFARGAAAA